MGRSILQVNGTEGVNGSVEAKGFLVGNGSEGAKAVKDLVGGL